jgi:hypothetical protein
MVHALREAHRVLKPNGLLFDLRPGLKHRRVGLSRAGRWHLIGTMRENFSDDRAANAAVALILREGLFRREKQMQLDLKRYLGTLKDLRTWLDEYYKLGRHDWLVKRVQHALHKESGETKIVVRGPLEISVMRKVR